MREKYDNIVDNCELVEEITVDCDTEDCWSSHVETYLDKTTGELWQIEYTYILDGISEDTIEIYPAKAVTKTITTYERI